ncbi:MAG: hypothetical protein A2231_09730 [Candidatus Firestonebacteria bacterium RIFOXYA2_FULL_40_8]|nr:MAG: hypothetical protein A2231_09730 [Candidatus Firestonebacteria bacterium RIFOXYA2_FULL_40_8]
MKKIRLMYLIAFIQGIYIYIMRVMLQPFVLSISNSMPFVGFIDGLTNSVIPSLVQLPGGWIADRIGRKKPMIFGSILIILGFNMYTLAVLTKSTFFIISGAIFIGLGTIGLPARDSFVAESVGKSKRVMAFNMLAFFMVVPGVASSMFGGKIADKFGYGTIFMMNIFLEAVCLIIFIFYVKESLLKSEYKIILIKNMKSVLKNVFKIPRHLAIFYFILAIDAFFWGVGYRIIFGLLRDKYALSHTQIGILGSVFTASWAVFQIPIGKYMMQRSCKLSLIVSEIVGCVGLLGIILFKDFYLLLISQIFLGLMPAFWIPATRTLISNSVVQNKRAEALGRFVFFNGLTGFLGPIVGGFLYQVYGLSLPLIINIIGGFLLAFAIIFFIHETKDKALSTQLLLSKIEK